MNGALLQSDDVERVEIGARQAVEAGAVARKEVLAPIRVGKDLLAVVLAETRAVNSRADFADILGAVGRDRRAFCFCGRRNVL
jgi:hypothetical protein